MNFLMNFSIFGFSIFPEFPEFGYLKFILTIFTSRNQSKKKREEKKKEEISTNQSNRVFYTENISNLGNSGKLGFSEGFPFY
jgi:hypothetical protein